MKHALSISALGAALLVAAFATTTDAEAASRRVVATDGQGNAASVSGGAIRGPNGRAGVRAGMNTRSADGSATHQSGMSASGSQGSVQSTAAPAATPAATHPAT